MGVCRSSIVDLPNPHKIDLSHFQEYKVIGRGGFGTVHAVVKRDPTTGKDLTDTIYAMKRLSKEKIVTHQVNLDMLWLERDILIAASETLKSNFLCQLYWAFQSDTEVFLVMEFMQGGDLRFQMRTKENLNKQRPLAENIACYYAAEILLALNDLHNVRIVYRDLKPENALLDHHGHLRLADFGIAYKLSSRDDYKTTGRSGTLGYMSPEMLMKQPYGTEVDVWAYGVTLYELLHADLPWSPYQGPHHPSAVMEHFSQPLLLSPHISPEACDLLSRLLHPELSKRLTSWKAIKAHPFFASIDWQAVATLKVTPPIIPQQGVANCTSVAQLEAIFMDEKPKPVPDELQEVFADFEYIRPDLREGMMTVDLPVDTGADYVVSLTNIDSTSADTATHTVTQTGPNGSDDAHGVALQVKSTCSDGAKEVRAKDGLCFNPDIMVQEIPGMADISGLPRNARPSQARLSQCITVNARKVKTSASRNNSISSLGEDTDEYLRQHGLNLDPSEDGSPEASVEDVYSKVMRMMGTTDPRPSQANVHQGNAYISNGRGSMSGMPRASQSAAVPRNSSSHFILREHSASYMKHETDRKAPATPTLAAANGTGTGGAGVGTGMGSGGGVGADVGVEMVPFGTSPPNPSGNTPRRDIHGLPVLTHTASDPGAYDSLAYGSNQPQVYAHGAMEMPGHNCGVCGCGVGAHMPGIDASMTGMGAYVAGMGVHAANGGGFLPVDVNTGVTTPTITVEAAAAALLSAANAHLAMQMQKNTEMTTHMYGNTYHMPAMHEHGYPVQTPVHLPPTDLNITANTGLGTGAGMGMGMEREMATLLTLDRMRTDSLKASSEGTDIPILQPSFAPSNHALAFSHTHIHAAAHVHAHTPLPAPLPTGYFPSMPLAHAHAQPYGHVTDIIDGTEQLPTIAATASTSSLPMPNIIIPTPTTPIPTYNAYSTPSGTIYHEPGNMNSQSFSEPAFPEERLPSYPEETPQSSQPHRSRSRPITNTGMGTGAGVYAPSPTEEIMPGSQEFDRNIPTSIAPVALPAATNTTVNTTTITTTVSTSVPTSTAARTPLHLPASKDIAHLTASELTFGLAPYSDDSDDDKNDNLVDNIDLRSVSGRSYRSSSTSTSHQLPTTVSSSHLPTLSAQNSSITASNPSVTASHLYGTGTLATIASNPSSRHPASASTRKDDAHSRGHTTNTPTCTSLSRSSSHSQYEKRGIVVVSSGLTPLPSPRRHTPQASPRRPSMPYTATNTPMGSPLPSPRALPGSVEGRERERQREKEGEERDEKEKHTNTILSSSLVSTSNTNMPICTDNVSTTITSTTAATTATAAPVASTVPTMASPTIQRVGTNTSTRSTSNTNATTTNTTTTLTTIPTAATPIVTGLVASPSSISLHSDIVRSPPRSRSQSLTVSTTDLYPSASSSVALTTDATTNTTNTNTNPTATAAVTATTHGDTNAVIPPEHAVLGIRKRRNSTRGAFEAPQLVNPEALERYRHEHQ